MLYLQYVFPIQFANSFSNSFLLLFSFSFRQGFIKRSFSVTKWEIFEVEAKEEHVWKLHFPDICSFIFARRRVPYFVISNATRIVWNDTMPRIANLRTTNTRKQSIGQLCLVQLLTPFLKYTWNSFNNLIRRFINFWNCKYLLYFTANFEIDLKKKKRKLSVKCFVSTKESTLLHLFIHAVFEKRLIINLRANVNLRDKK